LQFRNDSNKTALLAVAAWGMCLPIILFDAIPGADTSVYYSAMIREIAAGRWEHGFYPMIPPLFPVFGALFAWIGFLPFTAAKIASSLCFAAGVFPLYHLCRLVWNRKIAIWSCVLYILCPRLVRYGGAGLLDPGKTTFLLVTVYGLLRFSRYRDWRSTLYVFVGSAGMSLVRGEGITVAALLITGFIIVELIGNRKRTLCSRIPVKSLTGILIFLLLLSPWLIYMWHKTGYPLTDSRQAAVAESVLGRLGYVPHDRDRMPEDALHEFLEVYLEPNPGVSEKKTVDYTFWTNIVVEIVKGLVPVYLIFALPVIISRIRSRRWCLQETVLLMLIVGHTALLVCLLGGNWVQKRYVIHAMPFLLGWTVYGMRHVLSNVRRFPIHRRSIAIRTVVCVFTLIMVWDATLPARPSLRQSKQAEKASILDTAKWLRQEGAAMVPANQRCLSSTSISYHNGRQPVVVTSNNKAVALLGDCDLAGVAKYGYRTFDLRMLRALCDHKKVNFLVIDRNLASVFPDLADPNDLPEGFHVVYRRWEGERRGNVVIGVQRNLTYTDSDWDQ